MLSNYQDIIELFNLYGKVGYIITDNAANTLKEFIKFPGVEADSGGNESDESDDEDEDIYMPVDSLDVLDYLPEHISCFIHTLQLVVHDEIKQIGAVSSIVNKVSKMVSFVRHSCQATSLSEGGSKLQAKMIQDGTI